MRHYQQHKNMLCVYWTSSISVFTKNDLKPVGVEAL